MQKRERNCKPIQPDKPFKKEITSSATCISDANLQGHPERMLKVNPFAQALIFTKSVFSEVFWDEK